jgi:CRISPR-associated endonuclease/helicase Cas3
MPSGDGKPVIRFRVQERGAESNEDDGATKKDWRESLRFDLRRNADGEATRWLSVQKWRDTSNNENDRAAGRPQALVEHRSWAAERAAALGRRLDLPDEYIRVLSMAARLHDEGKQGRNWKRAFHVEHCARELGIPGQPLAKTPKFSPKLLGGYRHEFGSLPYAQQDDEFKKLSPELQDLVLHLIAAHHGFARPLIATDGCEDAPPSALEERAREVALRYARLHLRWGPWGLAWWEALLRAADVQASKQNDERKDA